MTPRARQILTLRLYCIFINLLQTHQSMLKLNFSSKHYGFVKEDFLKTLLYKYVKLASISWQPCFSLTKMTWIILKLGQCFCLNFQCFPRSQNPALCLSVKFFYKLKWLKEIRKRATKRNIQIKLFWNLAISFWGDFPSFPFDCYCNHSKWNYLISWNLWNWL